MPGRWFRISFSRNALLRLLAERELSLDDLSVEDARQAMTDFFANHKPQHAELDELTTSDRKRGDRRVLTIKRRMQRHDHPVASLRLSFANGTATLVQS